LNLEERLGYVHKGIEKIAEGRTPESLARLAGRISGDTTVGHCWAACMAMEQAAGVEIPSRAAFIRGILAERNVSLIISATWAQFVMMWRLRLHKCSSPACVSYGCVPMPVCLGIGY